MSPEIALHRRGIAAFVTVAAVASLAMMAAGCRQDMFDQPKHEALEGSDFFDDGSAQRQPPEGTVSRTDRRGDTVFYSGVDPAGGFVATSPMPIRRELLERGRERFGIFCSPCHGMVGDGSGMIVQRGFKRPQSFHSDRLRGERIGYFVDVITNGFGVMPSYAAQVPPEDRWAIAAYIGVLQLSQSVRVAELPREDAQKIERSDEGAPKGAQ